MRSEPSQSPPSLETAERLLQRVSIGSILALAAILRVGSIFALRMYRHAQDWEFGNIARGIVHGLGYTYMLTSGPNAGVRVPSATMPPAYPYILAGFLRVFGDRPLAYLALELTQAALSVLLVYLVFQLALIYFSREAGTLAALVCAVYPAQVFMCNEIHSISFYIVFGVASVFFFDRYLDASGTMRDIACGAVCMGLLLLFRAEAIALVALYALCMVVRKGAAAVAPVLVMVIIPSLFLLPWVIRNYEVFDAFIPTTTTGGMNLWIGHNADATGSQHYDVPGSVRGTMRSEMDALPTDNRYEPMENKVFQRYTSAYIREHPVREVSLAAKKLFIFLAYDPTHDKSVSILYWGPSLLLSGAALWGLWLRRRCLLREDILLVATVSFALLLGMALFVLPRYRIVVDPFLIVMAAAVADRYLPHIAKAHSPVWIANE